MRRFARLRAQRLSAGRMEASLVGHHCFFSARLFPQHHSSYEVKRNERRAQAQPGRRLGRPTLPTGVGEQVAHRRLGAINARLPEQRELQQAGGERGNLAVSLAAGGQRAPSVRAAAEAAEAQQQYQPRRLQVRHGRDTLQECVLGRARLIQEREGARGQPSLAGGVAGTGRPPSWGLRRARWQHAAGVQVRAFPK